MILKYRDINFQHHEIDLSKTVDASINGLKISLTDRGVNITADHQIEVLPQASNRVEIRETIKHKYKSR